MHRIKKRWFRNPEILIPAGKYSISPHTAAVPVQTPDCQNTRDSAHSIFPESFPSPMFSLCSSYEKYMGEAVSSCMFNSMGGSYFSGNFLKSAAMPPL